MLCVFLGSEYATAHAKSLPDGDALYHRCSQANRKGRISIPATAVHPAAPGHPKNKKT